MNKAWANSPDEGYRWVRLAITQTYRAGLEAAGVRRYNNVSLMWKVRSLFRHGGTAWRDGN